MKIIIRLVVLFILAQLIGLLAGVVVFSDMSENPYVESLMVTTDSEDPANAFFFIGYIIAGAVLMIIMIRFMKVPIIFQIMEFFLISGASSIVFYSFLRLFLGFAESMAGGVVLGLLLSLLRLRFPGLKNIAVVFATAGVGVVFGVSLGLIPLVLLLILLSVYDFAAVFLTKHMVELADFIVKKDLAFTITSKERISEKEEQRLDLGSGDMIAPVMLEVSTLTLSPVATIMTFLGATISMGIFLIFVWEKKMVLPALPPIVGGMLLFLFAGMILGLY
jgi:presenilin-like A22 family membrane protease